MRGENVPVPAFHLNDAGFGFGLLLRKDRRNLRYCCQQSLIIRHRLLGQGQNNIRLGLRLHLGNGFLGGSNHFLLLHPAVADGGVHGAGQTDKSDTDAVLLDHLIGGQSCEGFVVFPLQVGRDPGELRLPDQLERVVHTGVKIMLPEISQIQWETVEGIHHRMAFKYAAEQRAASQIAAKCRNFLTGHLVNHRLHSGCATPVAIAVHNRHHFMPVVEVEDGDLRRSNHARINNLKDSSFRSIIQSAAVARHKVHCCNQVLGTGYRVCAVPADLHILGVGYGGVHVIVDYHRIHLCFVNRRTVGKGNVQHLPVVRTVPVPAVAEARHMEIRTVLAMRAQLRIQDSLQTLSGDIHLHQDIVEGLNTVQLAPGDLSRIQVFPDAATVHQGKVSIHGLFHAISNHVPQCPVSVRADSHARIILHHGIGRAADNTVHGRGCFVHIMIDDCLYSRVCSVLHIMNQLSLFFDNVSCGPVKLQIHIGKSLAILPRLNDKLAVRLTGHQRVIMGGKDNIHLIIHCIGQLHGFPGDILPRAGSGHMSQHNDGFYTLSLQLRRCLVDCFRRIGKAEVPDACRHYNVGSLPGNHTNEANRHSLHLLDDIRLQHGLALVHTILIHHIGSQQREILPVIIGISLGMGASVNHTEQLLCALVKLVVAHNAHIKAHLFHHFHNRLILEQGGDRRAAPHHIPHMQEQSVGFLQLPLLDGMRHIIQAADEGGG
ncbi:hypothetical protein D3C75_472150 [compost metagenome]